MILIIQNYFVNLNWVKNMVKVNIFSWVLTGLCKMIRFLGMWKFRWNLPKILEGEGKNNHNLLFFNDIQFYQEFFPKLICSVLSWWKTCSWNHYKVCNLFFLISIYSNLVYIIFLIIKSYFIVIIYLFKFKWLLCLI